MRRLLSAFSFAAALAAFALAPAMADCDDQVHAEGCVDLATVMADELQIARPFARAMIPGQANGAGYVVITNRGEAADRLVHATTVRAARTEIHSMEVVDDVMVMRPVDGGLEIAPGETLTLEPGGYHLMFIGVADPLTEGEQFEVTLEFEEAGRVQLIFPVEGRARQVHDAGHDHGEGGHDHQH